jgi:UPF0042 nucleotide-binding protein
MAPSRIVVVTGMAGAGRSTCLKALEDGGFEAVDNLPLDLLGRLLGAGPPTRDLAIGIDSRTRDFAPRKLSELLRQAARDGLPSTLLYLECDDEILRRRFTETRRRHPMAVDRPVGDGIARERSLLAPLKAEADIVIDTSLLTLADFRRVLAERFEPARGMGLAVTVISFAYRQGLPREADMVVDARFLINPHYVDHLRPLTGLDAGVQAHVRADPDFAAFVGGLEAMLLPLLPRYHAEGKSYFTIGVGCTGGRHRSVFVAEELAARLETAGWPAKALHRELAATGLTGDLT